MKRYIVVLTIALVVPHSLQAVAEVMDERLQQVSGITEEDCGNAVEKKTLGIFDLYALAVKYSETMKISEEGLVQAEAGKKRAFGAFLPTVSLRASLLLPKEDFQSNSTSSMKNGLFLYARQPIITGLDEWSTFKGAKYAVAGRTFMLKYAAARLLYDVSFGYYNVLFVRKSLAGRNEILKLYTKNHQELNRRVALGKSRQSEALRTYSQISKLEAEIKSLNNELQGALLDLSTVVGYPVGDRALGDGVELGQPADVTGSLDALVNGRWDVKAAAEEVKQADSLVLSALGGHFPSLYLEGAYRLYQEDKKGHDYFFGVGAELPLFSGFITTAKIREAKSLLKQSELKLGLARRNAAQDIMDSYRNWVSSGGEIKAYKKAYQAAEDGYRASLNDYRLNLVTSLDLIMSLTALQNARDDYDRIVLQHKLNRLRLGIAVNELTGSGVRYLMEKAETEKSAEE